MRVGNDSHGKTQHKMEEQLKLSALDTTHSKFKRTEQRRAGQCPQLLWVWASTVSWFLARSTRWLSRGRVTERVASLDCGLLACIWHCQLGTPATQKQKHTFLLCSCHCVVCKLFDAGGIQAHTSIFCTCMLYFCSSYVQHITSLLLVLCGCMVCVPCSLWTHGVPFSLDCLPLHLQLHFFFIYFLSYSTLVSSVFVSLKHIAV